VHTPFALSNEPAEHEDAKICEHMIPDNEYDELHCPFEYET
jgi:hypothetical protein